MIHKMMRWFGSLEHSLTVHYNIIQHSLLIEEKGTSKQERSKQTSKLNVHTVMVTFSALLFA